MWGLYVRFFIREIKMSSKVRDFYKNQNVLISGGTGFLGKVLIEKLLRDTDVANIFVLVRNTKGKSVEQRIEELFESPLFDKLKTEKPLFKSRVTPIYGDCVVDNLGLSGEHRETLTQNTNIVFHVAATVRFDEHIKKAYDINVKGTESLMKLCREMTSLKAVVYVSTAYSNCHLSSIDEIIYENDYKYKEVEELLAKLSYEEAEKITPKLLGARPNTYTFTKGLAEEMLLDFGDLPVAIFRPGVVESTYRDPIENWGDNNSTVNILLKFISLGLLRIIPCNDEFLEVVPVDLTISALIASAWDVQNTKRKDVPVYNYVSSVDNPLSLLELFRLSSRQFRNYPPKDAVWVPKLQMLRVSLLTGLLMVFHHYPLALLLDFFRIIHFKKPQNVYTIKKLHQVIEVVKIFSNTTWTFSNENVKEMWNKMNEADRVLFNFDIASVQWIYYLRNHFKGLRLYFLKEYPDTLPEAKQKLLRLQVVDKMVGILINFLKYWWIVNLFDQLKTKL